MTAETYSFTISGGYTPATIPLERLGEYLTGLGRFLGEEAYVHFEQVVEGSVLLRARVDEPARPKVLDRVEAVRSGVATIEIRKHYQLLDDMLRKDNAYAALAGDDRVVIPFPGRNRPEPVVYGPFRQHGIIDGVLYRIGGRDASIHLGVHSADRDLSVLEASKSMALRLRHHLFGGPLRFRGEGTWVRHGDGRWELKLFRVDDFEELDTASLIETVARLRAATGSALSGDPVAAVLADRSSEGQAA